MYWMAGPLCTEYRVSGEQPTMTSYSVDCTQTTSQEDMDMPLLCSTGTRKKYPRKMVLMNAAQVEEQAHQCISHGTGHEVEKDKDNKQRFARMLAQSLEHVGCETRHAKGDADILIVETTVQSAMSCETTLVGDDPNLLVLLCFRVKEDSCEVFFKPEVRSGTKKSPRSWNIKNVQ